MGVRVIDKPITAPTGEIKWNYTPPSNTRRKLLLLHRDGCAAMGPWGDGAGWIAWCPLPKRDKELEVELGHREKP